MTSPTTNYLIDSSVLIPYLRRNQAIVARLDAPPSTFINSTIIAELAFGAHRSNSPGDGLERVDAVVAVMPCVVMDEDVGYTFAEAKDHLVKVNQLIPDSDIWIAATAIVYGLTLVTRDAHFARLAPYGLALDRW